MKIRPVSLQPLPARRDRARQLFNLAREDAHYKWRLGYGTFVSRKWNYLYVDTPKCASTATKRQLWNLEEHEVGRPPNIHVRRRDDPRLSLLSLELDEFVEFVAGDGTARFFVYRDPDRRLASAYFDKIQKRDPSDGNLLSYDNARYTIRQIFSLGETDEITLSHFISFACSQTDGQRDAHWMSQSHLTMQDLISFNHCIRTSHYEDDMRALFKDIGAAEDTDFSVRHNVTPAQYTLSPEDLSRIRTSYSIDYQLGDFFTSETLAP